MSVEKVVSRSEVFRLTVGAFYLGGVFGCSATARSVAFFVWGALWLWDWSSR